MLGRWFQRRKALGLWFHAAYRLPLALSGISIRRPEEVLYFFLKYKIVLPKKVHTPKPISYASLSHIHTEEYLHSLSRPGVLAHIFAVDANELMEAELLHSLRLACGGTVEAAHWSLQTKCPALNLLGGFHHAAPSRGAGFCALNDLAVAIAELREQGFKGPINILDLDAHPPDGTAECLKSLGHVWMGSLSASLWGTLPGVDETLLPEGSGDTSYLEALKCLLARMPLAELNFVLAGGDVLADDPLGQLSLSLAGVRQRDQMVASKLNKQPSVWLPAGGYGPHAWKVFAGTGLALAYGSLHPIPEHFEPMAERFQYTSKRKKKKRGTLRESIQLGEVELGEALGNAPKGPLKLLGVYSSEAIEFALERFQFFHVVRRLGYSEFRLELSRKDAWDKIRVLGQCALGLVLLAECELGIGRIKERPVLYINWLTLCHPMAKFRENRPQLPGQSFPGLGLSTETAHFLLLLAKERHLDGVVFKPSWYHMAYAARRLCRFVEAQRQGRFLALMRDLERWPLLVATQALAQGKVQLNGQPYVWEPLDMVHSLHAKFSEELNSEQADIAAEAQRCHFSLEPERL
ncbi:MAG: histone deacetylase [Cystobacterineae bacterium]|nr:histone deacetylase [Cystobacterineae bacterium]